jgi:Na+-driven multidrug efflux pump
MMQSRRAGLIAPAMLRVRRPLQRYMRLGGWTVLSHIVAMIPAIPTFVCLVGIFFNSQSAATVQALGNVLGITNPFLLALLAVIVPAAARAQVDKGPVGAWEIASRYGKIFAVATFPYYVLLFVSPRLIASFFYGSGSRYLASASFLRWLALSYALTYLAQVIGGFLRAVERMEVDFAANAAAAAAALVSFILAARHYAPLVSLAFSFVLATALRAAILSWWTVRITRAAKQAPIPMVAVS